MAKTASTEQATAASYAGLEPEQLIRMYRLMYLSRRTDDREVLLKRQQKIFFQVSGAGHEAFLVAAGMALKPGYDWFYPYYRDRALCLTLGQTVEEQLLQSVGAAADPSSGGRQMPSHWSIRRLNIVSQSSSVTTQCLQAVGCAEAGRYLATHPAAAEQRQGDYSAFKPTHFHGDEVVYVSLGEGATSEGEFWEAISSASGPAAAGVVRGGRQRLRHLGSGGREHAGGKYLAPGGQFPQFLFCRGGWHRSGRKLCRLHPGRSKHCRSGKGPAFVHGHVIRQYAHSFSDDEPLYRSEAERKRDAALDPLPKLQMRLLREGILDPAAINRLEQEVDEEVRSAAERVLRAALPEISSIKRHVYSEDLDPTREDLARPAVQTPDAQERTMADLINCCLKDEMQRDPRIVVFGQDVADTSHDQELRDGLVKGKGGVFKLTAGLQREFGPDRVYNARLAEADIVGRAVGMATRGLKPVVEVQFFDYIWPAMHQLRNEVSLLRWRSNGTYSAPVVIRVAIGGYLTGGSVYHSQCGESIFTHTPGIRVVFPSNALDANGLLRTAIRCDDPVLFFEHKRLYRETFGRAAYPGPDFAIPFGKANLLRQGKDITLITYGAVVPRALRAAQQASS